jgi:hypothetical protein
MAQTQPARHRRRVQVKVFDVDTGEERYSSETIIENGILPPTYCSCSSCSTHLFQAAAEQ